ncbi:thioesterase superfamily [Lysobacter enzymogenes]|uniref:Thioesterase superfamily n=1 Tax=Lysobacter enzymogenes TaxID=69 RepID=A0A0S2DJE4_LYSEN|nr:thioesterase superfamily [Lysobacter enzymogenes]
MSDSNNEAAPKAKTAKPPSKQALKQTSKQAATPAAGQTAKQAGKKTSPRKRAPRKRNSETAAPAAVESVAAAAPQADAGIVAAAAPAAEPRPARAQLEPAAQPQAAPPAQLVESFAVAPAALIRVPLSVRWRDLDAFNHVNNSKFLSYLEEARLRWMVTLPGHGMDEHVAPVVAAAHLNYRRPIEWPNEIDIELFVERLGNTSLSVGHRIVGANDPTALYCDGNVVLVWIHRETGQPAALPEPVRAACAPR